MCRSPSVSQPSSSTPCSPRIPALAERLRTAVAGDSVMATTDLPLDPSSATAAGIKDEFVRRLRDGEAKLVDAVSGAATQRAAWLYDVAVTPDGAATLSDLGVQMLVMPFLPTTHSTAACAGSPTRCCCRDGATQRFLGGSCGDRPGDVAARPLGRARRDTGRQGRAHDGRDLDGASRSRDPTGAR